VKSMTVNQDTDGRKRVRRGGLLERREPQV
jgi:hypothetical protein